MQMSPVSKRPHHSSHHFASCTCPQIAVQQCSKHEILWLSCGLQSPHHVHNNEIQEKTMVELHCRKAISDTTFFVMYQWCRLTCRSKRLLVDFKTSFPKLNSRMFTPLSGHFFGECLVFGQSSLQIWPCIQATGRSRAPRYHN